jgi:hypothetical protein
VADRQATERYMFKQIEEDRRAMIQRGSPKGKRPNLVMGVVKELTKPKTDSVSTAEPIMSKPIQQKQQETTKSKPKTTQQIAEKIKLSFDEMDELD